MSPVDQEVVRVSLDKQHNLLKQEIHGKIRIVDPWEVTKCSKDRFKMTLDTLRSPNDVPYTHSPKILAFYTTENVIKTECLKSLLRQIVDLKYPGLGCKFEERFFQTPKSEDLVGRQPFSPYGQLGNLCRIEEVFHNIKEAMNPRNGGFDLKDYLAVFILSIESDIDDKRDGPPDAIPHDQPNMMIYECFSGQYLAGVGRGPGVQKDLLAIAKEHGFKDKDGLAGNIEYGSVLSSKFSGPPPIDPKDWHGTVSDHPRSYYFNELCDEMLFAVKEKFSSGEINFHLPDKDDVLLG
ncbi:hypothetical protein PISL3812_03364 [Talaromyces islandicus]|uniref:Uncharacterized protein n=1 Tax=Talaromyces islandicus TaxID=28573 RepID=A0A0U1LSJ2_TALIS|nr:hypothetical protein PISL3812_03364 [Talaromyces islandicus]